MCEFCENSKTLIQKDELISPQSFGWGDDERKICLKQAVEFSLSVFVDRGYLRLVDPTDCNCLDHDEKKNKILSDVWGLFKCPITVASMGSLLIKISRNLI